MTVLIITANMIARWLLSTVLFGAFWSTTKTWSLSIGMPRLQYVRLLSGTKLYATKSLSLRETVDFVKETVLLSEIVGEYVDVHEETGRGNVHQCLCPFHNDRNPSMHLNDDKGLYYCFSCGAGGDLFHFVQQHEQCTFAEAVQHIVTLAQLNVTIAMYNDGNGHPLTEEQRMIEAEMLQKRNRQERILLLAASYYTAKVIHTAASILLLLLLLLLLLSPLLQQQQQQQQQLLLLMSAYP